MLKSICRKLTAVLFSGALAAAFLALFFGFPVKAGSTSQGDANGDGSLDTSDCVYLLSYLFGDGPAPVALAQDPPVSQEVMTALMHFMPRAQDLYYEGFSVDLLSTTEVLTVPAGLVFVLTHFQGGPDISLLVNGEGLHLGPNQALARL